MITSKKICDRKNAFFFNFFYWKASDKHFLTIVVDTNNESSLISIYYYVKIQLVISQPRHDVGARMWAPRTALHIRSSRLFEHGLKGDGGKGSSNQARSTPFKRSAILNLKSTSIPAPFELPIPQRADCQGCRATPLTARRAGEMKMFYYSHLLCS